MAYSPAAHLVAALVLTAARTGEFVTEAEAKQLQQFDDTHAAWLTSYLVGTTCDAECKSRALSVIVSHFAAAKGSYDKPARALLESPRAQSGMAVAFLHTRLLWCQVDAADMVALRDRVLVPATQSVLANPKTEAAERDGLLSLVLLVTEPTASDDPTALAAWQSLLATIQKAGDPVAKAFADRRATAERQRRNPPAALKKRNFCGVTPPASDTGSGVTP
jgi:hypothetical protein